MPELVIKYKDKKTLDALIDFSKYFEFSIVDPPISRKSNTSSINGVTIIPADSSVDTGELEAIFSGKHLDAKKLREDAWQRSR